MTTIIDWPASWQSNAFELRISPNTRTFRSPYSNASQTLDLGGEVWRASVTLQTILGRSVSTLEREAFFDRLAGGINNLRLWHLWNPTPRGTFANAAVPFTWTNGGSAFTWTNGLTFSWTSGTLALVYAVAAGANTCTLQSISGRTALAGDMVSINGELKRVLTDSTTNGAGELTLTFGPRARSNWTAYSAPIVTTNPTAVFQLLGEVPTKWMPGASAGASFDLIEVINT